MTLPGPPVPDHRAQFPDQSLLLRLLWGYMTSDLVELTVRLGLADRIGDGAHAAALAHATDTDPSSLLRLLRALAALGLLRETGPEQFALTPAGARLRGDDPGSLRAFAEQGAGDFRRAFGGLEHSIRTGEPAFDRIFGTGFFQHLGAHPELSATFQASMRQATRTLAAALPAAYAFSRVRTVVDVGGADGALLAAVLAAHPELTGVLYDSPEGAADAPGTLGAAGVADRCRISTGDFFTAVPEGGDLYVLKSVLHDWSDTHAERILRTCRTALAPHSRLLVIEVLMPERVTPDADPLTYLSDLYMLANMGGRERTEAELRALLVKNGFGSVRVAAPAALAPFALIEAHPC
ncbi:MULTISPECIES: methyltransferase [Streptomyces]|uniref:O-methyltransferase n=3 Tax=Streptomyces TaxID=1883 RepID=A0A1I6S0W1_9ACTN|nr:MULTISPECIES: methyltransferase [Streptomyces]QKV68200.1 methyltransferase [Streptomyces harbinensis]SFS70572.1 O-methyltransferase [Streptomyces harbinensis]